MPTTLLVCAILAVCISVTLQWLRQGLTAFTAEALIGQPPEARLHRVGRTATVAEVAAALEAFGVVVIENRSSAEDVAAAYAELQSGRMESASVRFGDATNLFKQPIDGSKEKALKALIEDPLIQGAAEKVRLVHGAGSARCAGWQVRLLILRPGFEAGDLHRDVADTSKVPLERPLQWGLNAIWAIDDFTAENGATRFVPGSHVARWPQGTWGADHSEAAALARTATMPAGSVVLYYASVLHGSGENRAQTSRAGLNFNYAFVDSEGGRPAGWGW